MMRIDPKRYIPNHPREDPSPNTKFTFDVYHSVAVVVVVVVAVFAAAGLKDTFFFSVSKKVPNKKTRFLYSLLLFQRLLLGSSDLCLLLRNTFGKKSIKLCFLVLLHLNLPSFERTKVSTTLKTNGSYQTLDFRTRERERNPPQKLSTKHGQEGLF